VALPPAALTRCNIWPAHRTGPLHRCPTQIQGLAGNREAILDALSPLGRPGQGVAGGEGAIYFWARLPEALADDEAVVAWLVEHAGVCIIPGGRAAGRCWGVGWPVWSLRVYVKVIGW
jgi:hypothetical protein